MKMHWICHRCRQRRRRCRRRECECFVFFWRVFCSIFWLFCDEEKINSSIYSSEFSFFVLKFSFLLISRIKEKQRNETSKNSTAVNNRSIRCTNAFIYLFVSNWLIGLSKKLVSEWKCVCVWVCVWARGCVDEFVLPFLSSSIRIFSLLFFFFSSLKSAFFMMWKFLFLFWFSFSSFVFVKVRVCACVCECECVFWIFVFATSTLCHFE